MQLQYNARVYRPAQTAPQRIAGVTFIAILHTAVVYALLTSLGFVPMPKVLQPIIGRVIPDDQIIPPPVPPQPTFQPPRPPEFEIPVIEIAPANPGAGAITLAPTLEPATPSPPAKIPILEPPPPLPLIVTPARAIAATHTIPDYPPVSRRLGEQGTLRLRLSIGPDGSVSEAQLESSSGHSRLDEAAVRWVKAHWRYEPAREGSKAVASTVVAEVTYRLQ